MIFVGGDYASLALTFTAKQWSLLRWHSRLIDQEAPAVAWRIREILPFLATMAAAVYALLAIFLCALILLALLVQMCASDEDPEPHVGDAIALRYLCRRKNDFFHEEVNKSRGKS